MREEKKYLAESISNHLNKSNYTLLVKYKGCSVKDIEGIRSSLKKHNAEFHVVKNSALKVAIKIADKPSFFEDLKGQIAIITGGDDPSGVAKIIVDFNKKNTDKLSLYTGSIGKFALTKKQISILPNLPKLEILRTQLIKIFSKNAENIVCVLSASHQSMLNVLNAYSIKK